MTVYTCRVYLEEMFDPGPEPAVPAVDEHCQVLRHDGGLGAALQLQHSHTLLRVKQYVNLLYCQSCIVRLSLGIFVNYYKDRKIRKKIKYICDL